MSAVVPGDDQLECIVISAVARSAVARKRAMTSPLSRSHTFSVLSSEAETARCLFGVVGHRIDGTRVAGEDAFRERDGLREAMLVDL